MNQNTSNAPRRASTLRRALIGTAALGLGVVGFAACGSDEEDPAIESVPGVIDTVAPLDTSGVETTVGMETVPVETTVAP